MSRDHDLAQNEQGLAGDMELQTQALEDLADAPNYQAWLCSLATPYLGGDPLELGSGTGDYAQNWLDAGQRRITLTEIDPGRHAILERRFRDDARVTLGEVDIHDPRPGGHSAMVSFNVLEHIEDDVAALRCATTVVRPGGYVIHYVPAFPFAMSAFDREIGHFRRYRLEEVRSKAESAGLVVEDVRYVNMPGLVAWFVMMRLLRRRPAPGPLLKLWDGVVIRWERWIESHVRAPFGQSVLLVARTPGTPTPSDGSA
jgi:SAM-dependent methyltransferase